jgi:hypothetical protein
MKKSKKKHPFAARHDANKKSRRNQVRLSDGLVPWRACIRSLQTRTGPVAAFRAFHTARYLRQCTWRLGVRYRAALSL